MRRKAKQNSSAKHRNIGQNHVGDEQLDVAKEKTGENGTRNGLNSHEQQTQRVDTSSASNAENVVKIETRKSFCRGPFLGILKVVVLIIIIPPFLNYASLQREAISLQSHGKMHDGPRGKLFMHCMGKGLPVVMMDAPGGYSSDMWSLVQTQVAKFTKVCVYDRAGIGFSERAAQHLHDNQMSNITSESPNLKYEQLRPTTENMVADIRYLLKTLSNNTNNILLVGGGLGAVNARFYARFYEDIFAVVLVNPFHENMFMDKDWLGLWYDHIIPSLQINQLLALLGVTRLGIITRLYKPRILENDNFKTDAIVRLKYLCCNSQHLSAGIMEHYYTNESLSQLKILQKLKPFPQNISVNIISSKNYSNFLPWSFNKLWYQYQQMLVTKSFPNSERIIVDNDFNTIYLDNVDILVKTIKKLVVKFRKSVKESANM
ncbi:uncharacterized protein LOC114528530 [Dendronephthya gigantea]|uniref:uncharacterized protein LOC114528530 n=1 Tax=Dendronephthya gigantea TaxID=151771 RepID=UPI00106988EA|nr:uncharacterized protein LOC114528530 [Dendronephthya gigantea]